MHLSRSLAFGCALICAGCAVTPPAQVEPPAQVSCTTAPPKPVRTKVGWVYVISNQKTMGEGVYKIGMTHRLDPYKRIKELGDASVPYPFKVEYLLYTADAQKLETALHHSLNTNRMNKNREFFKMSKKDLLQTLKEVQKTHPFSVKTTIKRENPSNR